MPQKRITISINEKTYQKLDKLCGKLIPHSRYIESILEEDFSKKSTVVKNDCSLS